MSRAARATWLATLLILVIGPLAASPALAAGGTHVFASSFGEAGSGAGALELQAATSSEPGSGLTVNQSSGDIYVADTGNHRVDQFSSAGAFIRAWGWGVEDGSAEAQTCTTLSACQAGLPGTAPGQFEDPRAIAVDDGPGGEGDVYVADFGGFGTADAMLQKFDAEGQLVASWGVEGQLREGALTGGETFFQIGGLVVDPSGNLWAATDGLFKFSRAGAFLQRTQAAFFLAGGPAVAMSDDASGGTYLSSSSAPPNSASIHEFDSSGAHLGGLYEPSGSITGLALDDSGDFNGELYVGEGASIAVIPPTCQPRETLPFCTASTSFGAPQLSSTAGLAVDSATSTVYAADPTKNEIQAFIPEPPSAPQVTDESAAEVTATSAELRAGLNPKSNPGESPTTYHFEYGPCPNVQACPSSPFPSSTPDGSLEPSFESSPVAAVVQGLAPGTAYHYRLVATNDKGTSEGLLIGAEEVARTFTTQGPAVVGPPDARQWQLVSPPEKLGASISDGRQEGGRILAAADGSAFTYLANGATEEQPKGFALEQQILSTRTAAGWDSRDIGIPHLAATGTPAGVGLEYRFFTPGLTAAAIQPFGQFDPSLSGEASESTPYLHDLAPGCGSCYRPLVTGQPGFANVPLGTQFGEAAECAAKPTGTAHSICGPRLLGASEDLDHMVLRSLVPLSDEAGPQQLYEWTDGELTQVSVLPGGALNPDQALFSPQRGTISPDGSRVIWSALLAKQSLFLRDLAAQETVQLDQAEAGCLTCESGLGSFQAANADSSKIIFTAGKPLTAQSGSEGKDLYQCLIVEEAGELKCELADLTPEASGESADVLGVIATSPDASSFYFVATGALDTNPNSRGEEPAAGQPNLYLRRGPTTTFIATLAGEDEHDWAGTAHASASASPDGDWLAFMSQRPLTGYDNRDAATSRPAAEVYLYDSLGDQLRCVSCNPTGGRPNAIKARNSSAREVWPVENLIAATLPAAHPVEVGNADRQVRYLDDSGRLFFNAYDGLLPGDSNRIEDVYQYEPASVGACTESDPTFSQASAGCLGLLSTGASSQRSVFLEASESGEDVFFLTSSQLAAQDIDSGGDVYDAHLCSTAVPCFPAPAPPPPNCEGDACQQPATPPAFNAPGTALNSGPENERQAKSKKQNKKKKHKSKNHKQRHRKHNQKGGKSHKRAANDQRRAGR
jgi:hypothetical protein